jgi:hypothetical protein
MQSGSFVRLLNLFFVKKGRLKLESVAVRNDKENDKCLK